MRCAITVLLGAVLLLGIVVPAEAAIITVDPDDFALGADISDAVAGVTLAKRLGANPGVDPEVYSLASSPTPQNQVFGHVGPYENSWGGGIFEYLEASFDTPTNWVSLDFIPNSEDDVNGYLQAWDSNRVLIETAFTDNRFLVVGVPVTLQVVADDIAYIRASWDDIGRCRNGELDNLQFEGEAPPEEPQHSPEPSSIIIWSLIGLTCGVFHYRRKRRTVAG